MNRKKVISIRRAKNRRTYLERRERQRCKPHVDRVLDLYRQLANIKSLNEVTTRRLLRLIKAEISAPALQYGVEYFFYQGLLYALWKSYCRGN